MQNALWSRASVCVCVCVCLSVRGHTPTLLYGPGCNLGAWWRLPPSCALLGRFAIGARVALLLQHNAKPSLRRVCACCWLVTSGWRGRSQNCVPYIASACGWLAGDWPSAGGILNITAAAWTAGFQWWRSGDIMRTQNVSEYMLILSTCLVIIDLMKGSMHVCCVAALLLVHTFLHTGRAE